MDETFDLNYLFKVLKKHILFIAIIGLIGGIAAFTVSNFLITKKYTSEALLYVENNQQSSDSVNINDINAAQKLVNTCQILFKSSTVLESIIDNLNLSYSKSQLDGMITTQAVNNTEIMSLTVESSNPQEAQLIVNEMVRLANLEFARVIKSGSIEVITYGEISTRPSSPNVRLITLAGLLLGVVFSYMIVFIKEIFDVVVKHDDDIAKIYNIPVFAEINDFFTKSKGSKYGKGYYYSYKNTDKTPVKTKPIAPTTTQKADLPFLSENTPFAIAEAYNTARTNIMFAVAPADKKIVVVTSPNPSEGKSTTCRNLAIAFANAGHHILLIDADLRKPTIAKAFGIKKHNGLSAILGGFCSVKDAINIDVSKNLDIITAGDIPPNPSELLGSVAMKTLLEASSEQYDYVFIDTPPVNFVIDSQLMNEIIAGMVIVVKESSTTHPDIQATIEKITLANGKPLGFVKSFCNSGKGSYKKNYKRYKYGYNYSSTSTSTPASTSK